MKTTLLLFASLVVASAFKVFTVSGDQGATVQLQDTLSGESTIIGSVPLSSTDTSITVDLKGGTVYVSSGSSLVAMDLGSGAIKKKAQFAGSLRHIAYDYKHAAAGAPGESLYGLLETKDNKVSLLLLDKESLAPTTVVTLNTTGHVTRAYLGLPKPQFGEPEGKHYGVILSPAGSSPAPGGGEVVVFLDLRGTYHHWGYVEPGMSVQAIAMDYDHHNCYVVFANETAPLGTSFAIMHMLGGVQKILSVNENLATPFPPSTAVTTIDMANGVFYTVQTMKSSQVLSAYALKTGSVYTVPVAGPPITALYFDATPL